MSVQMQSGGGGRPLTGRMVLAMLLGFFGTVIAVNMVMLSLASSTFSGIEEKNAYTAGLSHNRALAAARAQDQRGWNVEARLERVAPGRTLVQVEHKDGKDARVEVTARFEHPTVGRADRRVVLDPIGAGLWRAHVDLPAGAWDLVIEMRAAGELLFRSHDRIEVSDDRDG